MQNSINYDEKDLKILSLVETIFQQYGYDFRGYAPASLKRRIERIVSRHQFIDIFELRQAILKNKQFFLEVLSDLTVTVTEMFRDPEVFKQLHERILPRLASYPSIRIWHAGCSTGEEVYSMAILLQEYGLLNKTTLYATDVNPLAIQKARLGVYNALDMKQSTENYLKVGLNSPLSNYYASDHNAAVMDSSLKERIVFAEHNLVTDDAFSEVHLVLCRNVFIYFNKTLQNLALELFNRSLCFKGFLCLGSKESLQFSKYDDLFRELEPNTRIYQKLGS